ncbi:hypothetical protein DEJ49_25605 [Streptomyces venezuelae]|uniref:Uncharacterized protein n=1 Tax=Streptomyces venezuelae TaxID=54571 RepID=A0A5P2CQ88_STRVZ|nr:hypothetical protein [Streptomyces venezuelae]QES43918.1 hypothetical protein DEJ49_25605 [Streptomyces venezuelae]
MTFPHPKWDIPEHLLARSVFGPLGGIVEIGAVATTGTWSPADASTADFAASHRRELSRLLEIVRRLGEFSRETMAVFDDLGHLREHSVQASSLLMWSSAYEDVSSPLDTPEAVRRMSRTGADLQLARLLQGLMEAAITRGPDVTHDVRLIAEALGIAVGLLAGALEDEDPLTAQRTAFRIWRTTFLTDLLLPTSAAHPEARPLFRQYGHALEALPTKRATASASR